jgi:hypothetical protein
MSLAGMAVGNNFKYNLAVLSSPPNEEFVLTSFWILIEIQERIQQDSDSTPPPPPSTFLCTWIRNMLSHRCSKSLKMIFLKFLQIFDKYIEGSGAGTGSVIQNLWIRIYEPNLLPGYGSTGSGSAT